MHTPGCMGVLEGGYTFAISSGGGGGCAVVIIRYRSKVDSHTRSAPAPFMCPQPTNCCACWPKVHGPGALEVAEALQEYALALLKHVQLETEEKEFRSSHIKHNPDQQHSSPPRACTPVGAPTSALPFQEARKKKKEERAGRWPRGGEKGEKKASFNVGALKVSTGTLRVNYG